MARSSGTEVLPVKLPQGTRRRLAEVAKRRYESSCASVRKAIMRDIEEAEAKEGICPITEPAA
jgi:hypothetical protein